ncbi:hypothetical protein Salat_1174000 [Sesamum alatum]|uniref:Uncharacterized protein n=1 Tax=Sesamum alatum TaxID=300844 RepID=A0AAE1YEE6_9LAMI|nr:hypothetical protein Salat_1174000 [Sesamum alatum]
MGVRWRISSGQLVEIAGALWLPSMPILKLVCALRMLAPSAKVMDLLEDAERRNRELVLWEFVDLDAEYILKTPTGGSQSADKLVWHHDPWGKFSVRSENHLATTPVALQTLRQSLVRWIGR